MTLHGRYTDVDSTSKLWNKVVFTSCASQVTTLLFLLSDSQRIPKVLIEPRSTRINPASSVSLVCNAGSTEATYKWQRKTGRIPAGATIQDGGRELRFTSVIVEDTGIYICKADNNYGSDQAEATLEVIAGMFYAPSSV